MSRRAIDTAAPIAEDSDEALMLAYAAGRAAAFDTLYARHKGGVYRYLLRHCGNAGIADELFQDVWMNAIRARDATCRRRNSRHGSTRSPTTGSSITGARAARRSSRRSTTTATRARAQPWRRCPRRAATSPKRASHTRQLREQLHAALATLPAVQRDAFLLQHEGGLSLAEIAELTGVGVETVKSRLRYAVAKLRGELSH